MNNTIIAYDTYRTYIIVSQKHYELGDIIGGDKIVYAIINDDSARIATTIYEDGDINGVQRQTIAYHSRQYCDSVGIATHIEYRKENNNQYRLYNGDTEDVYETVNGNDLLNQIQNDLTCLLMGEETKRQVETLNLYDQGYENKAIRDGKVVYTEWIQRPKH